MGKENQAIRTELNTDYHNPAALELLGILDDVGFPPPDTQLANALTGDAITTIRYGGSIVIASGIIIRRLVTDSPENKNLFDLLGVDPSETDLDEIYERLNLASTYASRYTVVTELIKILNSRNPKTNITEGLPAFPFQRDSARWQICKDSEFKLHESATNLNIGKTVFIDNKDGTPYFYQKEANVKTDIANNGTAINLVPIKVNGVYIPEGTLVGIYTKDLDVDQRRSKLLPIDSITGIFPLRLTLFSVSPSEVDYTFGSNQVNDFLYQKELKQVPDISIFRGVAEDMIHRRKLIDDFNRSFQS